MLIVQMLMVLTENWEGLIEFSSDSWNMKR